MQKYHTLIFLIILASLSCTDPDKSITQEYGAIMMERGIQFRLHAPSSMSVELIIFQNPESVNGTAYNMNKNAYGDWEIFLQNLDVGTLYGYRLSGPLNNDSIIVADPYSKATVTQNKWRHVAKSLVMDENFDWQGDTWLDTDHRDLIIYEAHLRDMTKHNSSGSSQPGTYLGFMDDNQLGGISHLKQMGVNAIQFLPIWDYANVEIPFMEEAGGMFNDWNPYERNHWGYMPTFFFAPESFYASDGTREPGMWNGKDGKAVRELKELIRELHKNEIAVILDIVVNHVSNYDWHPLKFIDREMYFKLDNDGNYLSQCCGNLLNTDNKYVQQYIIESLKYWMEEYHIDGFRFDQAHLLSLETAKLISDELRKIHPNVIIYGEAWNNMHKQFSEIGWGSFNDQFRDVIRGDLHDFSKKGFLFGSFRPNESKEDLKRIISGSTVENGGNYKEAFHSINFIEVHDDYCFSDYLRLSSGENGKDDLILDKLEHIKLSRKLNKMNKLGAFILFTSQGIPLIHQGQEWGHSKVIAETFVRDPQVNKMDPNSYNKDNETNWVNWKELDQNKDLLDFYQSLISIRKKYPQFRKTSPENIEFLDTGKALCLGYKLPNDLLVYINGDNENEYDVTLPIGKWKKLLSTINQNEDETKVFEGTIPLAPISGIVFIK